MELEQVIHSKQALSQEDCDHYLKALLTEIPWAASNNYFHRRVFRYSKDPVIIAHGNQLLEITQTSIQPLDELIIALEQSIQKPIKGVFCNYYEDGNQYASYHKDQYGSDILSLTLGATRDFYFKHDTTGQRYHYALGHGDIFYFPDNINLAYKHSIPIRKKCKEPRINLTCFLA